MRVEEALQGHADCMHISWPCRIIAYEPDTATEMVHLLQVHRRFQPTAKKPAAASGKTNNISIHKQDWTGVKDILGYADVLQALSELSLPYACFRQATVVSGPASASVHIAALLM